MYFFDKYVQHKLHVRKLVIEFRQKTPTISIEITHNDLYTKYTKRTTVFFTTEGSWYGRTSMNAYLSISVTL